MSQKRSDEAVCSFCWFPVFFWPLLVQVARVMTSGKSIHQPGSARHQVGSAFLRRWWSPSNFPDYDLANIWGPRAAPPYEMLVQSFATSLRAFRVRFLQSFRGNMCLNPGDSMLVANLSERMAQRQSSKSSPFPRAKTQVMQSLAILGLHLTLRLISQLEA